MRKVFLVLVLILWASASRAFPPVMPVVGGGSGSGDILADGSVPFTGNVTAPAFVGNTAANAAGEFGYTANAFSWYANSEDFLATFTANLVTFSSGTSATFAFTPDVSFTGDITVVGSDVTIGAAGVKLSADGDGAITFLGLGNGFDEDLIFNFDDVENTVGITSSTGVTTLNFGAMVIQAGGLTLAASATPSSLWNDSDAPGADKEIAKALGAYVSGADGSEAGTLGLYVHQAGTSTEYIQLDGVNSQVEINKTLVLGANNITGTGSIGATGAGKFLKGWFIDFEFTNVPTINGGSFLTAIGGQGSDAELAAIAGLTFADKSIIQLTGSSAAAVLTCTAANQLIGVNAANDTLECKSTLNISNINIPSGTGDAATTAGNIVHDTDDTAGNSGGALEWFDGAQIRSIVDTGTNYTVITKTEYIPIRYAEDGTTAPSAAAEVSTTTAIARSFSEADDVVFWWVVPNDYVGGIKYRVLYALSANANADDTAVFSMAGSIVGNSGALAGAAGTALTISDELTTDDDQFQYMATDYSAESNADWSLVAGGLARLEFSHAAASDMAGAGEPLVIGIEIKYKAKIIGIAGY